MLKNVNNHKTKRRLIMFTPKSEIDTIQSKRRVAAAKARLFNRVQAKTLEKLNKSLEDLEGRYELGKNYADPKPSQNWKVVKQGNILDKDELEIWLKVGIIKVKINEDGSFTKRLSPSNAKLYLTEMRDWVESLEEDAPEAEDFKAKAIEASHPKSAPNQKKHPGMNGWKYDDGLGQYKAILK